jgi:acetaldehyde dehydrogenase (acetylating)
VKVPPDTRVLIAPLAGVGRDFPLSIEKLSPVLAFYVVKDWHEGCERVLQLLRYGGTGHTMAIHSKDDAVIREFALRKPVFRIIANTQSSMGATGYATGLAPSMSLGCGAYAGNITSDNITPMHLMNVKRLAYELPREGRNAAATGAPATDLAAQVSAFVSERLGGAATSGSREGSATGPASAGSAASGGATAPPKPRPEAVDFVSEDDVRRALREGRTIVLTAGAIVTPSARDLADGKNVLRPAG